MKKIVMTKKGAMTMTLIQTDQNQYVYIVGTGDNATSAVLENAFALNAVYVSLKAKGYTVKTEKEPKKEAPKAPKPQKTPTWDFGEGGFDRQKYLEIAKSNNWTWCDPRGKLHVMKCHREEVYLLMGAKKN